MTANPIVVTPGTTVAEVARVFIAHRIGCVPVVNDHGTLVGLVTGTDLFIRQKTVPFSTVSAPILMGGWMDPSRLEETYQVLRSVTARDVMTRQVVSVDAEAPVGEAARLMMRHERKHLPVIAAGTLVGILTRHDVLRALCESAVERTSESLEGLATAI